MRSKTVFVFAGCAMIAVACVAAEETLTNHEHEASTAQ
jgi:hypothetical protein